MSNTGKRGVSLGAAMQKIAGQDAKPVEEQPKAAPPATEREREKTVMTACHILASDHERIKALSFHSKTSIQQLGIEAWSMLLVSKGHDPLKPTTANLPSGRNRG